MEGVTAAAAASGCTKVSLSGMNTHYPVILCVILGLGWKISTRLL